MTEILKFPATQVLPDRKDVLAHQGVSASRAVSGDIEDLCDAALELLAELAEPVSALKEVGKDDFATVYLGEGQNESSTPVGDIFMRADRLALFAVTLGQRISREISRRFEITDFALGSMLDSAASTAADKLAGLAQQRYFDLLVGEDDIGAESRALRYSPGYCGWHISGQRKLFGFLRPDQIGISLTDSFLMDPLKSVSGVVLAGPREIHDFEMTYSFCSRCEAQGCRERINALKMG